MDSQKQIFSYQGHEIVVELSGGIDLPEVVQFDGEPVSFEGYPIEFGSFCREVCFKAEIDGVEKLFCLRTGYVGGTKQKRAIQLWLDGQLIGGVEAILFRYRGEMGLSSLIEHMRVRGRFFFILAVVWGLTWIVLSYWSGNSMIAGVVGAASFTLLPIVEYLQVSFGKALPQKQKGGA